MSQRPAYTIHSLNGGEVSQRFEARQDQNKYLASTALCKNFIPLILGGIRRREGTVFVAKTKFSGQDTNKVRLMRFLFSTTQAYVMELGHLYVRFFREDANGNGIPVMNGLVPFELVTPWNEDMLDNLYDFQSADIKDVCSDGTINVHRITRTAIDTFTITEDTPAVPGVVEDEPTGTELGNSTITLSAVTGDGITITASSAIFLAGDVDKTIESGAGIGVITASPGGASVTADVISAFATTGPIAAADWNLSGTGGAAINPSRVRKGLNITLEADLAIFRTADVGKFVAIYGGFIKITRFQSATKVFGHVYTTMRDAPAPNPVKTLEWTLYRSAWDIEQGFPTCGTYFQDRRFLCRDQTVWGSVSGDYVNFALGSGDGDGINRTISDNEINPILAIIAINKLLLMTSSGVYAVNPTNEGGALTPNDFNVAPTGSEGVKRHVPLRTLSNVLYIQFGGRNVREFVFNFIENKYKSPDMFRLADHIVEFNSIKQMDYQARPDSIIWTVREDGKVFPFVYERNEEVTGWARLETGENTVDDGFVQSLCIIPRVATSRDWVWMAVNREINGVIETYIEYMDPEVDQCREWREAMTDSAKFTTATNFVISGLSHLEGRTVWVIGDGMLFNVLEVDGVVTSTAIVAGGQVTVTPQIAGIAQYEVGLDYQSEAKTLEPVIPNELGGPLMARGWETAGARVRRTLGLKINGEKIPFRKAEDVMDKPIPLKKGKVGITVKKCDSLGRVTILQDVPFPAEVLNIMGRVAVSDEPKFDIFPEDTPQFFVDCVTVIEEPGCPDNSPVPAQEIVQAGFFDQAIYGGNRVSWGYLAANDVIQTIVVKGTPLDASSLVHFHDGVRDTVGIGGFGTANFFVGNSDEPSFFWASGATCHYNRFTSPSTFTDIPCTPLDFSIPTKVWVKHGNHLLVTVNNFSGTPTKRIEEYDVSGVSGVFVRSPAAWDERIISSFAASALYYYIVWSDGGQIKLDRVRRSDFATVAQINLTAAGLSSPKAIGMVDDSLFYVVGTTTVPINSVEISHIQNMTTVTIIDSVIPYSPLTNNFALGGTMTARFINNHLYWGGDGSDGSPHIYKFGPFNC
jgi:hypothetical protein